MGDKNFKYVYFDKATWHIHCNTEKSIFVKKQTHEKNRIDYPRYSFLRIIPIDV